MSERRAYGDVIGRSFGLKASPRLVTRSLRRSQIAMSRLSIGSEHLGMSQRIPPEDTFVLALYLTGVRRHELWSRGKKILSQGYQPSAIRIVNLLGEFSSYIEFPHETFVTYIPRVALNELTDDEGAPRVSDLACVPGLVDAVVGQLAAAASSAFARPQETSRLFVDHLALALCSHLISAYGAGGTPLREAKGRLSLGQARRAQEYMTAHCADDIALADVAKACDLSRGHFIKAFRLTTGLTPHQWLQQRRVELAQAMLLDDSDSIAEVAVACGFADQSHLTRVFKQVVGDSPAAWRRRRIG
jgi:AraC family transcriptional regulator